MAALEHLQDPRPRVALLGTYLELYNTALPDYEARMRRFAESVADALRDAVDVAFAALSTHAEQACGHVRRAEDAGVDALLLLSLGYTNSLTVTPALVETRLPLVLLNTQSLEEVTAEYTFDDLVDNHGMQGIQDIASVLVRAGRRFHLVTGLLSQADTRAALVDCLEACRAARRLRSSRLTRLGQPQAGMGDMEVDAGQLLDAFGIDYADLSPADLAGCAQQAAETAIAEAMAFDREHFAIAADLTADDHARSARLEIGLRDLVRQHHLDGLTFSFDHLAKTPGIETLPFLGISKLMGDGLAYAGEGDLLATAGGVMAHGLCGETNFTEMYTMDFRNNGVLNSHMAEGNWRMARRDRKPRLLRRTFSLAECQPFASLAFSLEPGPVTLFNLTLTAEGAFHFIALAAEVADFPALAGMDIPHFKLVFRRDLRRILNDYSRAGGTHHLSLVTGDRRNRFRLLARETETRYTEIETREERLAGDHRRVEQP